MTAPHNDQHPFKSILAQTEPSTLDSAVKCPVFPRKIANAETAKGEAVDETSRQSPPTTYRFTDWAMI